MKTMYRAQNGSPETTLSAALGTSDTTRSSGDNNVDVIASGLTQVSTAADLPRVSVHAAETR